METLRIITPESVNHDGLDVPGHLKYTVGSYTSPTYFVNLTTDYPDKCWLEANGVKKTNQYISLPNESNQIDIYGAYFIKTLPTLGPTDIDLQKFKYCVKLTGIDWTNTAINGGYTGNVEDLGRCVSLESIRFTFQSSENIRGNLNTMLDALFANGKVSGSLYVYAQNVSVTYNDSAITGTFSKHFDFSSNGWTERA